MLRRLVALLAWSVVLVATTRCATYASRVQSARASFEHGDYDGSIKQLQELVDLNDNDQLLYLMDLGLVFHTAGRYSDAVRIFLKADKLAEIKDYTSISQEAASVLLSDEVKPYKGEDFEKLLINMYLAIDYTLMGNWEDALVECRRVNHKLDLMISQGKLPYNHNSFAKYLAAVLFEAQKELNDAFVDYRTVGKWSADYPYLGAPLLRIADRLKMSQEFEEFKKKYPGTKDYRIDKNEGEIVLMLEQGKVPVKVPSEQFRLMPRFAKRSYTSDYAWLKVDRQKVRTYPLYDVEETAIKELDSRIALIATKKIGGLVAKEAAAQAVAAGTKNELAGALTRLVLFAQDQADLRSWTTLPARLHFARLIVPAGRHRVTLDMVMRSNTESINVKIWESVEVKAGQKVFLNYRTPD